MAEEKLFWAEQIAKNISARNKFHFLNKQIPEIKNPSVKSSSSLSGVLHIGRLSDIIRGEAVFRALKENNSDAKFIYVTEDMDPFRKIPAGVPKSFQEFIGMPVSDVPDPEGCHKSYGIHFKEKFFESFSDFLTFVPRVLSMREEYKKGNFNPFIVELVKKRNKVKEILEKFQDNPLGDNWSPWKPICDKCGKLQTTQITSVKQNKVEYICKDYSFEKSKAIGCNHEGTSDLKKANGKLVWKSEWAAQWKLWNVVSEGAGKEYNAPNSAWFINAEICEKILSYPMPEPIFYEHLLIDGQKMSASVGNVIYPYEWLEVGRPETLKFLYMKRISKTRNFSWADLPQLETELDKAATTALSTSEKTPEEKQLTKLYDYSHVKNKKILPIRIDYAQLAYLTPLFKKDTELLEKLSDMSQVSDSVSPEEKQQLSDRISSARKWVEKYASEEYKISFLKETDKTSLKNYSKEVFFTVKKISKNLGKQKTVEDIQKLIFESAKEYNVQPKKVFQFLYMVLLGKTHGPKVGTLVFAFGREKVINRLKEVS